jgi:hypothetical protein
MSQIHSPKIPTPNQILKAFNERVDLLMNEIRKIYDTNDDPQMISVKTTRLIQKWFKHGGKLPKSL